MLLIFAEQRNLRIEDEWEEKKKNETDNLIHCPVRLLFLN